MISKKGLSADANLYLILDTQVHPYHKLCEIAKSAVLAGVDIIQLRDKTGSAQDILDFARQLLKFTEDKIPFVINDFVELARLDTRCGVHLGQDDLTMEEARKLLGCSALIGKSCQTLDQALAAQEEGADYIGFGSVFKTKTKPEREPMDLNLLKKVNDCIRVPVFAIGGINLNNYPVLNSYGINRIAVCRDICESNDVFQTVKDFKQVLNAGKPELEKIS